MPNGNSFTSEVERRIRGRLIELTETYPQAEIARKAGISKANVHRYLKGNRIPASLCGAIIENLGVNANWLMTGRGSVQGAAPSTEGGQTVSSLMDLVEAMNQAARLNLGALTDKQHLKAARELSDQLSRYEQSRARLSEASRSVLRRVLDEWRQAYRNLKNEQCRTLRESARQLTRLCDDEDLRLEANELEAQTESMFGDERIALEMHRKLVTLTLLRTGHLDDNGVSRVNMLLGILQSHGRLRESLRMGNSALELASGVNVSLRGISILRMNVGSDSMELGGLERALIELRRSINDAEPASRTHQFAMVFWMLAQYWAGALSFEQCRQIGKPWWARAEFLMLMGLWEENAEAMRAALREYDTSRASTSGEPNTEAITIKHALQALKKPGVAVINAVHRELRKRQPDETALPADRFSSEVYESDVAWLAGQKHAAARLLENAMRTFESMDKQFDPPVLPRALYWRLVWRMRDVSRFSSRAPLAQEFFQTWIERGYARFTGVIDAPATGA